jgi:outer membrane protein
MRSRALMALLATGFGAPLHAQDTLHLTLEAAVQRALERSEEMRVARSLVAEAGGQVREAWSGALPQLTGNLVYTRQFASIFQGVSADTGFGRIFRNSPFGAANQWRAELTASQLLFAGGKIGAGVRAARSFQEGARAQRDETAGDLIYRVKRAYLDAALAGRLLAVAEANLDQARAQLRQVDLFRQAGTRAEYDLLRAQVEAANQEPAVVAAAGVNAVALVELKRLVNVPAGQPLVLATDLEAADGSVPVVVDDSLAAPGRPVLVAADANVVVREQVVRAARADRLPTLTVASTLAEQAFPQEISPFRADFRRSWTAELRLSVPIFLGFRTSGAIARAEAELERARAERDGARETVALEVAQARAEVRRAWSLLSARHETVRQAEQALHLASVRYANGLTTQLELSDARVLRQQAQVNEVQGMRDYLVAMASLERALGRPLPVVRQTLISEGTKR